MDGKNENCPVEAYRVPFKQLNNICQTATHSVWSLKRVFAQFVMYQKNAFRDCNALQTIQNKDLGPKLHRTARALRGHQRFAQPLCAAKVELCVKLWLR